MRRLRQNGRQVRETLRRSEPLNDTSYLKGKIKTWHPQKNISIAYAPI